MRPVVGTFAEELYLSLEPLTRQDEEAGWSLLEYVGAIGSMFQEVEDLVRDDELGPGWSKVMDLERSPTKYLAWLASFVGVSLRTGLADAEQRARIKEVAGFHRGSAAALEAAAKQYLTGGKTAYIRERDGSAYRLTVITLQSETPASDWDSAAPGYPTTIVRDALMEQKPGGLILFVEHVSGNTYTLVRINYADYTAVAAAYSTYNNLRSDLPAI